MDAAAAGARQRDPTHPGGARRHVTRAYHGKRDPTPLRARRGHVAGADPPGQLPTQPKWTLAIPAAPNGKRASSAASKERDTWTVIGLVALSGPLRLLSGPVGTAQALTNAPPGRLTGGELVAALSCAFLAGAGILAGRWWADRAS
jgi:hypothetical protein